ncbi:glycine zipper family protein [Mangrovibacter plantisponsor]|uniref:Outer membrane protein with glycine zipper n=1 Tax=Mangrovibacter plantisponsor TaxID=451513 RepID=A0A317PZB0_9ENTR|nr:glycine zipper family protein [Mangrovibacter plantisponsor]PWW07827.1 hypothetical protein DES37_108255 [Mangrovibacter plantisponsor]
MRKSILRGLAVLAGTLIAVNAAAMDKTTGGAVAGAAVGAMTEHGKKGKAARTGGAVGAAVGAGAAVATGHGVLQGAAVGAGAGGMIGRAAQ